MVRSGLIRPGTPAPFCGPSSDSDMARENASPDWTAAAAFRSTAGVTRFSVPRWSQAPQRPQLLTFPARSSNCATVTTAAPPSGR